MYVQQSRFYLYNSVLIYGYVVNDQSVFGYASVLDHDNASLYCGKACEHNASSTMSILGRILLAVEIFCSCVSSASSVFTNVFPFLKEIQCFK